MKKRWNAFKHILIAMILINSLGVLSGCAYSDARHMNKLKKMYSKNEVENFAKDYAKEKYGEEVSVGEIDDFTQTFYDYDVRAKGFAGYYIETDDYITKMDINEDGGYEFSDNKQMDEVNQAITDKITSNVFCEMDIVHRCGEMATTIEDADNDQIYRHELYEGDLENPSQLGEIYMAIYLAPGENNAKDVDSLKKLLFAMPGNFDIVAYTPEYYEQFKSHFYDGDYLLLNHYIRDKYCTALERLSYYDSEE